MAVFGICSKEPCGSPVQKQAGAEEAYFPSSGLCERTERRTTGNISAGNFAFTSDIVQELEIKPPGGQCDPRQTNTENVFLVGNSKPSSTNRSFSLPLNMQCREILHCRTCSAEAILIGSCRLLFELRDNDDIFRGSSCLDLQWKRFFP